MITAIVQFHMRERLTREEAREVFQCTAPIYRKMPGLVRKAYLLSEDGRTAGGVYLWRSRQAAEQAYTPEWRRRVAQRYGTEPEIAWFESPVVVDNVSGEIVVD